MKPYVPLGILYICSHLRKKGVEVEVFDTTFSSRAELFEVLQTVPPSVLGVYANLMTRTNVIEILRLAKEAGWHTVVGGPEPGAYAAEYLEAGADVVVIGEGEITMEELLPALRRRGPGVAISPPGWRIFAGSPSAVKMALCAALLRAVRSPISTRNPGRSVRLLTWIATSESGASTMAWARFL